MLRDLAFMRPPPKDLVANRLSCKRFAVSDELCMCVCVCVCVEGVLHSEAAGNRSCRGVRDDYCADCALSALVMNNTMAALCKGHFAVHEAARPLQFVTPNCMVIAWC